MQGACVCQRAEPRHADVRGAWFTWSLWVAEHFLQVAMGPRWGEGNLHLELENGVALSVETWLFLLFSGFGCRLGGEQGDVALRVGTFEHSPALP